MNQPPKRSPSIMDVLLAAAEADGSLKPQTPLEAAEPPVIEDKPDNPPEPAPPYRILAKAGPLRNGAERGGGSVWHAVTFTPESGGAALCGTQPAIMWSRWSPPHVEVTCKRCKKLVAEMFPPADEPEVSSPAL